jgi:hypothetical protein
MIERVGTPRGTTVEGLVEVRAMERGGRMGGNG